MQLATLATLALAPTPLPLVAAAARLAFGCIVDRHPDLFDRLGEHGRKTFGFDPVDLPFAFVVRPAFGSIQVVRSLSDDTDASAAGTFVSLLALLEGRADGDALFFSREIEVAGDMEAVLALRNALDNCGLDLPADLAASLGPLGPLVRTACEALRSRVLDHATWN